MQKMGCAVMNNQQNFDILKIMKKAENDPQYRKLLDHYREAEYSYCQLSNRLPPEDMEIMERYLAAGEAVYYHFSKIAYQCGARSRNK